MSLTGIVYDLAGRELLAEGEKINPLDSVVKKSADMINDAVINKIHELPVVGSIMDDLGAAKDSVIGDANNIIDKTKEESGFNKLSRKITDKVNDTTKRLLGAEDDSDILAQSKHHTHTKMVYKPTPEENLINLRLMHKNIELQYYADHIKALEQAGKFKEGVQGGGPELKTKLNNRVNEIISGSDGSGNYHQLSFQQEKQFYNNILNENKIGTKGDKLQMKEGDDERVKRWTTPARNPSLDEIASIKSRINRIINKSRDISPNEKEEILKFLQGTDARTGLIRMDHNGALQAVKTGQTFKSDSIILNKFRNLILDSDEFSKKLKDQLVGRGKNWKAGFLSKDNSTSALKKGLNSLGVSNAESARLGKLADMTPDVLDDNINIGKRTLDLNQEFGFEPIETLQEDQNPIIQPPPVFRDIMPNLTIPQFLKETQGQRAADLFLKQESGLELTDFEKEQAGKMNNLIQRRQKLSIGKLVKPTNINKGVLLTEAEFIKTKFNNPTEINRLLNTDDTELNELEKTNKQKINEILQTRTAFLNSPEGVKEFEKQQKTKDTLLKRQEAEKLKGLADIEDIKKELEDPDIFADIPIDKPPQKTRLTGIEQQPVQRLQPQLQPELQLPFKEPEKVDISDAFDKQNLNMGYAMERFPSVDDQPSKGIKIWQTLEFKDDGTVNRNSLSKFDNEDDQAIAEQLADEIDVIKHKQITLSDSSKETILKNIRSVEGFEDFEPDESKINIKEIVQPKEDPLIELDKPIVQPKEDPLIELDKPIVQPLAKTQEEIQKIVNTLSDEDKKFAVSGEEFELKKIGEDKFKFISDVEELKRKNKSVPKGDIQEADKLKVDIANVKRMRENNLIRLGIDPNGDFTEMKDTVFREQSGKVIEFEKGKEKEDPITEKTPLIKKSGKSQRLVPTNPIIPKKPIVPKRTFNKRLIPIKQDVKPASKIPIKSDTATTTTTTIKPEAETIPPTDPPKEPIGIKTSPPEGGGTPPTTGQAPDEFPTKAALATGGAAGLAIGTAAAITAAAEGQTLQKSANNLKNAIDSSKKLGDGIKTGLKKIEDVKNGIVDTTTKIKDLKKKLTDQGEKETERDKQDDINDKKKQDQLIKEMEDIKNDINKLDDAHDKRDANISIVNNPSTQVSQNNASRRGLDEAEIEIKNTQAGLTDKVKRLDQNMNLFKNSQERKESKLEAISTAKEKEDKDMERRIKEGSIQSMKPMNINIDLKNVNKPDSSSNKTINSQDQSITETSGNKNKVVKNVSKEAIPQDPRTLSTGDTDKKISKNINADITKQQDPRTLSTGDTDKKISKNINADITKQQDPRLVQKNQFKR
jgi:hypothetical protein